MATSVHPFTTRRAHPIRSPIRSLCLALCALCLTAALPVLSVRIATSVSAGEHVHSMAALESHLAQDPASWLHRSLRVRAFLGGQCTAISRMYSPSCTAWRLALTDPNIPASTILNDNVLPLAFGEAPPFLDFLRGIPLVNQVMPRPQILHSSVTVVYRIQVQRSACVLGGNSPCYAALLLDAIPPGNTTDWVQMWS